MNTSPLTLHAAPTASLEQPFDMLLACHSRVERSLALLQRLQEHLQRVGADSAAQQAATDVLRYFDLAAPLHHQDEELHVFAVLLADPAPDAALRALVQQLQHDHLAMERAWALARQVLQPLADGDSQVPDTTQHAQLAQFAALYTGHIRHEEEVVYPAARARLTATELAAMAADMMRRRGWPQS